ncbi:N-acetylmuramoyl-L-alanine amidase, partial [Streptomyces sp. SID5926]|nr:N-acetylmuramoyl-L-alanine amidase [Streptomyces sp. SID5926]
MGAKQGSTSGSTPGGPAGGGSADGDRRIGRRALIVGGAAAAVGT